MIKYICILLFIYSCDFNGTNLEGVYEGFEKGDNGDSLRLVKLYKDGYWMSIVYGNQFQSVYSCEGGKYKAGSKKYTKSFDFFSKDTSMIGRAETIKYSLRDDNYSEDRMNKIAGADFVDNIKLKKVSNKEPLRNSGMEGVWKIIDGQVGYSRMGDEYIKIYSYPRFAWVHFNVSEKRFIAAGGGTYQFDGKKVIETIDYTTYRIAIGTRIEWEVSKLSKHKVVLYDIDSFYDEEVWVRED